MNNFRCERSSPFRNDFDLLELHITCGAGEGEDAEATPASASFLFDDISTIEVENGTFCYAENSILQTSPGGGLYQVRLALSFFHVSQISDHGTLYVAVVVVAAAPIAVTRTLAKKCQNFPELRREELPVHEDLRPHRG